jgi:hypothetical protein
MEPKKEHSRNNHKYSIKTTHMSSMNQYYAINIQNCKQVRIADNEKNKISMQTMSQLSGLPK